jgi:type I restriction-modification system DNA methylase subunit/restriction endonuclease S subunit
MTSKYICKICKTKPEQLSHHKSHLNTQKHKDKRTIFKLELESLTNEKLEEKYKTNDIGKIINKFETKKKKIITNPNIVISNKEALKDKLHDIHNFLRNNGGGYGMNALKVFNILYGLKKIEEKGLIDIAGLERPYCEFSYILNMANENRDEELAEMIQQNILNSLSKSNIRDILFYEIPKKISGDVFSYLIKEIEQISSIEKTTNTQLAGKIYEYFIGRDQTAISELGAYFTDRHITEFLYNEESVVVNSKYEVPTMCDPFGGSGGFTVGYILNLTSKYPNINWKNEIGKVHHYDMNEDVIKAAALEFFCLTGQIPDMKSNLRYANSFTDEFENHKFDKIFTNPPYGGDDSTKTQKQSKRDKVKAYIREQLKTETDENIIKKRKQQLKDDEEEKKYEQKTKERSKVSLSKSSNRIQTFAKKHGLKANDKESVSLIQLMDLVDINGTVVGVLKEGIFFNRVYKGLRKCLIEQYNVRKVIGIPRDQFENTATKTSVLVFDNTEKKTNVVEFSELVVEKFTEDKFEEINELIVCTEYSGEGSKLKPDVKSVKKKIISIATAEEILGNNNISFNGKDYAEDGIIPGIGYELKLLGEICKTQNGSQLNKTDIVKGQYPIFGGGKKFLGFHDKYNREKCVVMTSVCNVGRVEYYEGKFWASRVITLHSKENDVFLDKYIAYILKSYCKILQNKQHGSCQSNIVKSKLDIMNIPIPKSQEKIKYWVDKISAPFNEKNEKQTLLENIEQELFDEIKFISETSEKVSFNKICECKSGKMLSKSKFIEGEYPVIGGGIKPSGYHNKFNKPKHTILCSNSGNNSGYISRYNSEVWASDCFSIHSKVLNEGFIYYYLKSVQEEIFKLQQGSSQPHVHSKDIEKKIKIPNPDKKLITDLEPKFTRIEQLKLDIKNAESRFELYIQELGNEAIKR